MNNLWAIREGAMAQIEIDSAMLEAAHKAEAARAGDSASFVRAGRIAVIPIIGPLSRHYDIFTYFFGGTAYSDIIQQATDAANDELIDAILLTVNSPGGTVDGLADALDALLAAKAKKPMYAQVIGEADSAAYYLISNATAIYAGRADMIGNIGTRLTVYDTSKAFADAGIEAIVIETGPLKVLAEDGMPINQEKRDELRRIVDVYYQDFVRQVVQGRGYTDSEVKEVATGRIFIGQEAVDAGLVDAIQPPSVTMAALNTAIDAAQSRKGRSGSVRRASAIARARVR